MKRIEACNVNILVSKLQSLGYQNINNKHDCILKLKELKINQINTNLFKAAKTNNSNSNQINLTSNKTYVGKPHVDDNTNLVERKKQYTGSVKTNENDIMSMRSCSNIENEQNNLQKRRYIPVSSANDSLVSNQLVLGSLDVYHDIFYGPYKTKLEDALNVLDKRINDTKYIDINVPTYIPEITYANISDEANIDYGNINFNCRIQNSNKCVDFKMNIAFFDINIVGNENIFKINLPIESNLDLYNINTKPVHGDLVVHYNKLNDVYLNSSTLSNCYLNKHNKNELVIDSGLFIMFNKDMYEMYYLNSPQFEIDFNIKYIYSKLC